MNPFAGKLYQHPAISVPLGVFVSIDVEILRDRPDLDLDKGAVMQIDMNPNGQVLLGTFRNGTGTCYATVAGADGKAVHVQEGLDFRILPKKGGQNGTKKT